MSSFIHQITSGLAGWLTYEHMRNGVDNLREAEFAKPIESIAQARGFEVKGEFPLPTAVRRRGAPPCIDFLLINRDRKLVVALETKFKKTDMNMAGRLGADAARLDALTLDTINGQIELGKGGQSRQSVDGSMLSRAVLVVWREAAIVAHMNREPPIMRRQFIELAKAMIPEDVEATTENFSRAMMGLIATKPVGNKFGSLRAGSTITRKRFWVASFAHRPNWSKIESGADL